MSPYQQLRLWPRIEIEQWRVGGPPLPLRSPTGLQGAETPSAQKQFSLGSNLQKVERSKVSPCQLFAATDAQNRFSHLAKMIMRRADRSRAGGYFRRANGDIRQMKEAATEPASMVEPTQRFKGFSLLFNALPA